MSTKATIARTRRNTNKASTSLSKHGPAAEFRASSRLVATAVTPVALSHITHLLVRSYAPIWGDATEELFQLSASTVLFVASIYAACTAAGSTSISARQRYFVSYLSTLGIVWLAASPTLAHLLFFEKSLVLGPDHGPLLFNGFIICPILLSGTLSTLGSIRRIAFMTEAFYKLAFASIYLISGRTAWWQFVSFESLLGHNPYTLLGIWTGLAIVSLAFRPEFGGPVMIKRCGSPGLFLPFLLIAFLVYLWPPQTGKGVSCSYTANLPPDFRILDRTFSITGAISVAQHRIGDRWIRYLRCDHSVLGGVWLDPGIGDLAVMESIYTAFHLQEGIRLVRGSPVDTKASALFICLGIGTAVTGLQAHGISTTVVEVDPAVVAFSQRFFGMQAAPDSIHVMDARQYLSQNNATFDYIVHDIFTGGAMPLQLLTQESWHLVRSRLTPEGLLAINFAGNPSSEIGQRVITTILACFKHCRAYEDQGESQSSYINMVMFCSSKPIHLRESYPADYLDSYQRRLALESLNDREVSITAVVGVGLLTDSNVRRLSMGIERKQHWSIMRKLFRDGIWQLY